MLSVAELLAWRLRCHPAPFRLAPLPAEQWHVKLTSAPHPARFLTTARLYERLNTFLNGHITLVAETADAVCAMPKYGFDKAENLIVNALYCSIRYCSAAALAVALSRLTKEPLAALQFASTAAVEPAKLFTIEDVIMAGDRVPEEMNGDGMRWQSSFHFLKN